MWSASSKCLSVSISGQHENDFFFFGELARQKELIYIPCPCIAISHTRARRHEHLGY
jgi:hypothetical protein